MKTLLLILMLIYALWANADYKHWLDEVESSYQTGNWTIIRDLIAANHPVNDYEKSAVIYYQAKVSTKQAEVQEFLQQLIENYPDEIYGQRGFVELANIALLERDYSSSLDYLLRTNRQSVAERDYLLSVVYLKLGQHPEAIRSAQDFIKLTKDVTKRELAYLQIVEAYISNGQYQQALLTLETMISNEYVVSNRALVDYRIAYCFDNLARTSEAINCYRRIITDYPFTEHSFKAERRLYDMILAGSSRVNYGDLGFIENRPDIQDRTAVNIQATPIDNSVEQFYLQVNAFSEEKNALDHSRHLENLGFSNIVFSKIVQDRDLVVVAVGPFNNRNDAISRQSELKDRLNLNSFIIRH